jgi:soluble lytic murein transglycosylase
MFSPIRSRVSALGLALLAGAAVAGDEDQQRRDYVAAHDALQAGNYSRYRALRQRLDGYVLRGYLDYEDLRRRLGTASTAEVSAYLEHHSQAPHSDIIRQRWLRLLAARGDWPTFHRHYQDIQDDPELACLRLQNLLRTSETQASLMTEIGELWRTGKRLPGTCNPVFAAWKKAGHMSADRVWERIRLAMEHRRPSLANELAHYLDPADHVWVARWVAMHHNPPAELDRLRYPVETTVARMVVRHGIVRLAMRDPAEAVRRWQAIKQRHQMFGEDDNYVYRHVGIIAAQRHMPEALAWLSLVAAEPADEHLHLWRVRAALRAGEWETARRFIAALPEEQQREGRWVYWKARSLEVGGKKRDAERLYRVLARERSYYGFLAADRLQAEYAMQHTPVAATPEEVSALLAKPGIQMAQELYRLGHILDARRQWNWIIQRLNNRELAVAAVLASQWGWHDRAILTASRSQHQDDLELRFPVLYRGEIEANAAAQGLDPGWVYGVVRQESAFVVDARSPVGALGLMQLMPATGRMTGRRLNIPIRGRESILNIDNNLRLGTGYLKEVLQRNQGHQTLATASYNAGPHRVTTWLPDEKAIDAEIWVETIPFNETRDYVKNVLAFAAVYDHRLGIRPTRLQLRMPLVEPPKPPAGNAAAPARAPVIRVTAPPVPAAAPPAPEPPAPAAAGTPRPSGNEKPDDDPGGDDGP